MHMHLEERSLRRQANIFLGSPRPVKQRDIACIEVLHDERPILVRLPSESKGARPAAKTSSVSYQFREAVNDPVSGCGSCNSKPTSLK